MRLLPTLKVLALGDYDGELRRAVLALKSGRRDVAEAFAERLWRPIDTSRSRMGASGDDASFAVVPVPTTRARVRQRGFDGCALIATLACCSCATVLNGLVQIRGDSQRGRGRDARLQGGSRFAWRGGTLDERRIVLLDDVVTTGATLEQCAQEVRAAGGVVTTAVAVATA